MYSGRKICKIDKSCILSKIGLDAKTFSFKLWKLVRWILLLFMNCYGVFCIFVELIAHKLQPCLIIVMKFYVQNSCVERLQMGFTNHLGASTLECLFLMRNCMPFLAMKCYRQCSHFLQLSVVIYSMKFRIAIKNYSPPSRWHHFSPGLMRN